MWTPQEEFERAEQERFEREQLEEHFATQAFDVAVAHFGVVGLLRKCADMLERTPELEVPF